jgi:guanine nucleotide-binding protein alpha-1 subunit
MTGYVLKLLARILDAISPEVETLEDQEDLDSSETASIIISSDGRPASAICGTHIPNYEYYRMRLEPLAQLEDRLIHLLSSPDEDEAVHVGPTPPTWENYSHLGASRNGSVGAQPNGRPTPTIYIPQHPFSNPSSPTTASSNSNSLHTPVSSSYDPNGKTKKAEVAVHITTNWKKAFSLGGKEKSPKSAHTGEIEGWWEDPDDPVHALNASAQVMLQLWKDINVRQRLQEKRLRLEESSGL